MTDNRAVIKDGFIKRLQNVDAEILTSPSDCWPYGTDNSRLHHLPDAVALVNTHEAVLEIMRVCNEYLIPVTPRGLSSGTTGAAVPIHGGLLISFERMDQIISIDSANRTLRAQSGVTNQAIQDYCKKHGFFWPPDPGSAAHCTLGGNLACNAAGPRAVKYGTCRENTLGIKAVTGGGDEIITGVQTSKGVVGLDLTRLLIGSEGTLALITEAVLKLTPLPEKNRTLSVFYKTVTAAAEAVGNIMAQSFTPCALELMDHVSLKLVRDDDNINIPDAAQAMLLIKIDGNEQTIGAVQQAVQTAAQHQELLICNTAEDEHEATRLSAVRKALSPALRKIASGKINEDIVVPVSKLAPFISKMDALSKAYALTIANFGHAGNGNLHVNILFDRDNEKQASAAKLCLSEVFDTVLRLGGTLSGEHGIGLIKRDYVRREIPQTTLDMMRHITRVFDPKKILNQGKSLP